MLRKHLLAKDPIVPPSLREEKDIAALKCRPTPQSAQAPDNFANSVVCLSRRTPQTSIHLRAVWPSSRKHCVRSRLGPRGNSPTLWRRPSCWLLRVTSTNGSNIVVTSSHSSENRCKATSFLGQRSRG